MRSKLVLAVAVLLAAIAAFGAPPGANADEALSPLVNVTGSETVDAAPGAALKARDEIDAVGGGQLELDLDRLLVAANLATEQMDFARADDLLATVEQASAPTSWHRWAALSARVVNARRAGLPEVATKLGNRVTALRPDLAGLVAIWEGDTWVIAGEPFRALASFEGALRGYGQVAVDGSPIGVLALGAISSIYISVADYTAAAATERELLTRFGSFVDREVALGRALALEATAAGQLSAADLREIFDPERIDRPSSQVVESGIVTQTPAAPARSLRGTFGVSFVLRSEDAALLKESSPAPPIVAAPLSCTPSAASDGFGLPMSYDSNNFGYKFLEADGNSGYHPGVDLNATNDCTLDFRAVARGCVRDTMSNSTDRGTILLEHSYIPENFVSNYMHGDRVYYSVGMAVSKGASIGNVDGVPTFSCHLHQEIREADHPNRLDSTTYLNTSKPVVGDNYDEPLSFISAHRSYAWARWVDEGAFTRYGTWSVVSGTGHSDDAMWAGTSSGLTNYARYTFTPTASGTHDFKVFIPFRLGNTTQAKYKLKTSAGSTLWSATVNQSTRKDEWVSLPSTSLAGSTSYRLEVSTDTGESNKTVVVDDFLIIRRP